MRRGSTAVSRVCKHQPRPTDEERAAAAEVKANGGTLTADELAHSNAFSYIGSSWSRARANHSIREMRARGRWLEAHCHDDGTIYVPRERS